MATKLRSLSILLVAGALLGGCASEGGSLFGGETASVAPPTPRVDPTCVALNSKIDALRREGVTERMQQASTGKSATVNVKRESLAKAAELDKANAEFQAKCSTIAPKPQTAQAVPATAAASAPAVKAPAVKSTATAAATKAAAPAAGAVPAVVPTKAAAQ